jgi:hypothetical protein
VTEYGMHDLVKGVGEISQGYLEFKTPGGDIGYVKWQTRTIYCKDESKPSSAESSERNS